MIAIDKKTDLGKTQSVLDGVATVTASHQNEPAFKAFALKKPARVSTLWELQLSKGERLPFTVRAGCMPLDRMKTKAGLTAPESNSRLMPEADTPGALNKYFAGVTPFPKIGFGFLHSASERRGKKGVMRFGGFCPAFVLSLSSFYASIHSRSYPLFLSRCALYAVHEPTE